jgi:hypothetical protein
MSRKQKKAEKNRLKREQKRKALHLANFRQTQIEKERTDGVQSPPGTNKDVQSPVGAS